MGLSVPGQERRIPDREGRPVTLGSGHALSPCRSAASGFTLMETLVAMMVLSIALVIIFQQFSAALNGAHLSEAHTRAVWHAREKMDELLLYETLPEGVQEGEFGDGYSWRYQIEQTGAGIRLKENGVVTYSVTVWISWQQGRSTKQLDIATLTLAESPNT